MSTISEISSRIHDDHDIRNVELLSNLLSAASNYWVLPTDILQANEPHQQGPPTLSPDLLAHPLHQMPRTPPLTATYFVCEGARHQRRSAHDHRSNVGPLLGETSSRFPTTFLVTPDRSVLTDPPFPQQAPPPGTQCTAFALHGVSRHQMPLQRHAHVPGVSVPGLRRPHHTARKVRHETVMPPLFYAKARTRDVYVRSFSQQQRRKQHHRRVC